MTSRYELTISTNYVSDWTYVEAFRELFQNALDNEIENSENKMLFEFNKECNTVKICNKKSRLEIDSLLLGSTTKADDERTIGKHGEGYKVAIVVLLREGKTVTVYNYGKREVWKTKLVKSKRFNGALLPVILVEKEAIWKKVPDNDLTIEVGNVTEDEYKQLQKKNLNLRSNFNNYYANKNIGRILLDLEEAGNIYVKGLYINNVPSVCYGYDFEPSRVHLDRDRKLVSSFDISWEASSLWGQLQSDTTIESSEYKELMEKLSTLIMCDATDVRYITNNNVKSISNIVVEKFKQEHGEKAMPVINNEEYKAVEKSGYIPIITNTAICSMYKHSDCRDAYTELKTVVTIKERLEQFISKIESKLTDEELEEINSIMNELD